MTADPSTIARGLTKAQQIAMARDSSRYAAQHIGKVACMNIRTARRLFSLGLIEAEDTLCFPTDLGLQVRDYLRSNER